MIVKKRNSSEQILDWFIFEIYGYKKKIKNES